MTFKNCPSRIAPNVKNIHPVIIGVHQPIGSSDRCRIASVFLKIQVIPRKPHAGPSKLLAEVVIGYLGKVRGVFSVPAHAACQSPPVLLALEFSNHLHSSPCMHGLRPNHGRTLHMIGARIGSDWNSVPISANQPWQAIPAAVGARARAAGIEGPHAGDGLDIATASGAYSDSNASGMSLAGLGSQALFICYTYPRQRGRHGRRLCLTPVLP
jgi:hypothetical protein